MIKTITTVQLRNTVGALYQLWGEQKGEIKLSGKNLHSFLSLKKNLETQCALVEETIATLAVQFGGETQENGSITIPQEQRAAANAALAEYAKETVNIEYSVISLRDCDYLPMDIYELILDFVEFKEEDVCVAAEE